MRKNKTKYFFLILLFSIAAAGSVYAQTTADYTLPVITSPAPASAGPAGWISNFYQFALMGVGLLAFGIIVYAGFKYALNPGGHSAQSDAKEMISQALLGLLLLLGAYIILRTINPQLVSLPTEFGLERLEGAREATPPTNPPPPGGGDTSGTEDKQARDFLRSKNITVNAGEPKTSLKGIHQDVLDEAVLIKKICDAATPGGCNIIVTGGTEEDSHKKEPHGHLNGYKIDIARNPALDNYITDPKNGFKPHGKWKDGTPLYLAPSGAIYAKEANHWDILVL